MKRRDGSGILAPRAKVSFTAFVYASPVQTIPWCDSAATVPRAFAYEVGTRQEDWGEGLSVFHNPSALYELPFHFFPTLSHHWLDAAGFHHQLRSFHPYRSITEGIASDVGADLSAIDAATPKRIENLLAFIERQCAAEESGLP